MSAPIHGIPHSAPAAAEKTPPPASSADAAPSGVFALLLGEAGIDGETVAATHPSAQSADADDDGDDDGSKMLLWADLALQLTPLPDDGRAFADAAGGTPVAGGGPAGSPPLAQLASMAQSALAAALQPTPAAANPDAGKTGTAVEWMFSPGGDLPGALAPAATAPLLPAVDALPAAPTTPALALSAAVTQKLFALTEFNSRKNEHGAIALEPLALPEGVHKDPAVEVALPPGSANRVADAFAEGMSARLGWMAEQKIGRAELELHPDDLGSIEIHLEMNGNHVRAEFNAATPEARHLLQNAMPRLHELFEAQGLSLTQADVNAQNQSKPQSQAPTPLPPAPVARAGEEAAPAVRAAPSPRRHDGARISEYV